MSLRACLVLTFWISMATITLALIRLSGCILVHGVGLPTSCGMWAYLMLLLSLLPFITGLSAVLIILTEAWERMAQGANHKAADGGDEVPSSP